MEPLMQQMLQGSALPMPSFPQPDEVRKVARIRSEKIFASWNLLNIIVQRHEATIQKRWSKKTNAQRKQCLLSAWPKMATMHRPDTWFFKRKDVRVGKEGKKEAYMWPYVNLEDLTKSKLLLLFLNSRGRSKPDAFARADFDACRFGHMAQVLIPGFLNLHVMMFTGRQTPETYGELIAWDDHPDAFEWFHSQRGFHPGEGLEVLEIQQRLYAFLVDCCKAILHDMSDEQLADTSVAVQPEPSSVSGNGRGLTSLQITAAEAPYRLPTNLDLGRLESLVGARLSKLEDQIWAMREDPSFFELNMLEWKEHRQENILDTKGRKHHLLDAPQQQVFWLRIMQNAVIGPIEALEAWGSLHDQVTNLHRLQRKHASRISPNKDLPEEYSLALYHLRHHLISFTKAPIASLKHGFVASPDIRQYYVRIPPESLSSTKIGVTSSGKQLDDGMAQLQWLMMTLFDPQQLHLVGLDIVIDELERLFETDRKTKDLVSSWILDQVGDLSIMSQCIHQIDLYQPWAAMFENEMVTQKDELEEKYRSSTKFIAQLHSLNVPGRIVEFGTPSTKRFNYPVSKRRTRENTDIMIAAEKQLDAFWNSLDQMMSAEKAVSPRLCRLLASREIQRTPQWIEPSNQDKSLSPVHHLTVPMSDLYLQLEHSTERTISRDGPAVSKAKLKTRGIARPIQEIPELEEANSEKESEEPIFKVDKRALKVFNTVFFMSSTTSQPGEVPWLDFVHALCSVGFAAEKLYGSVWQFNPVKLNVQNSIHFHEPHPSGKIPFVFARRHGRRLNRNYGWHGSMFTLEQ